MTTAIDKKGVCTAYTENIDDNDIGGDDDDDSVEVNVNKRTSKSQRYS